MRYSALILILLLLAACTPSIPKAHVAKIPKAMKVSKEDLAYFSSRVSAPVNVHYYGHGFVYITSSVGVRAAIDPFGPDTVHYPFPIQLPADFVLISHETEDHAAGGPLLGGNPPIYRSVTAEGLNRANGIPFHGIHLQSVNNDGANTAFTFTFDEIVFGYLGAVGAPLNSKEKEQIGRVDVLFLPAGNVNLKPKDLDQMALDLNARVIIPIDFKTDFSGELDLQPVSNYLSGTKFPVNTLQGQEVTLGSRTIPERPTVYYLPAPTK